MVPVEHRDAAHRKHIFTNPARPLCPPNNCCRECFYYRLVFISICTLALVILELVPFLHKDCGDCGCNQRWLLHRSGYTNSSPLTHLHTLCSSVPTLCRGIWGIFTLCLKNSVVGLGWLALEWPQRVQKSRRQSAGGCCVWNKPLLIQSSRLTEVHHSHYETDACRGIVGLWSPTSQVIVEPEELTPAFLRWSVFKVGKKGLPTSAGRDLSLTQRQGLHSDGSQTRGKAVIYWRNCFFLPRLLIINDYPGWTAQSSFG